MAITLSGSFIRVDGTPASGSPTAVGTNTITDSAASWDATGSGEHAGRLCVIVTGVGAGQVYRILSNTATVITVEFNWITQPTTGSTFAVCYNFDDIVAALPANITVQGIAQFELLNRVEIGQGGTASWFGDSGCQLQANDAMFTSGFGYAFDIYPTGNFIAGQVFDVATKKAFDGIAFLDSEFARSNYYFKTQSGGDSRIYGCSFHGAGKARGKTGGSITPVAKTMWYGLTTYPTVPFAADSAANDVFAYTSTVRAGQLFLAGTGNTFDQIFINGINFGTTVNTLLGGDATVRKVIAQNIAQGYALHLEKDPQDVGQRVNVIDCEYSAWGMRFNGNSLANAGTLSLTYSNTADTITRASGSFLTNGFATGDTIVVTGTVSNNGKYVLTNVTALVLTLEADDITANETVSSSVRQVNGGKVFRIWTNRVNVVDESDTPISGATVKLYKNVETTNDEVFSLTTDANGDITDTEVDEAEAEQTAGGIQIVTLTQYDNWRYIVRKAGYETYDSGKFSMFDIQQGIKGVNLKIKLRPKRFAINNFSDITQR